jgi:anti-anti-sigma factor
MKIEASEREDVRIVALDGKLDTNAAASFETQLEALAQESARSIVVDLAKLDFITSSGLRVLIATAKRLKAGGGELCVCGLNQTVGEAFDISGVGALLRVFHSVDDALKARR